MLNTYNQQCISGTFQWNLSTSKQNIFKVFSVITQILSSILQQNFAHAMAWACFIRARLFSKSSLARLQEFWNSSICLYDIKKKNLSKSTCPTGGFTCPGPSGSGKRRALFIETTFLPECLLTEAFGQFHWHGLTLIIITCPVKCGWKLLIHSQTSTVQPLKFGNG